MTEEGVIRARKIELVDGDGNAHAMLDGEGLADRFVDLVVNGGDGRVGAITLGVRGSVPALHMKHVGGGSVTVTFGREGKPDDQHGTPTAKILASLTANSDASWAALGVAAPINEETRSGTPEGMIIRRRVGPEPGMRIELRP